MRVSLGEDIGKAKSKHSLPFYTQALPVIGCFDSQRVLASSHSKVTRPYQHLRVNLSL